MKDFNHQSSRLVLRDAARAAIEQEIGIELGRCRTVAAHDIIGKDLEFRLRIEFGIFRQHQGLRHLLTVAFLRVGPDDDLALEHATPVAVEYALEQLSALASGTA